jgi:hypothetical protein
MNRLTIIVSTICVLISVQTHAAVIERDWKTPGDGLLTFDTINKREWLDLSQTILDDRFPGTGGYAEAILESRYQYVVGQTAAGGLFEGFRVVRSPHIPPLAQSAGIDTSTVSYSVNAAATAVLGNLLGFTSQAANGNKRSIGLIDEVGGTVPFFQRRDAEFLVLDGSGTGAGLRNGVHHIEFSAPPGVMLYRAIPEPSTFMILALSIFHHHCGRGGAR